MKRKRELASIALGEFRTKLVKNRGALAGEVATLSEIQSALPERAAFVAWVDISPLSPNSADPDGEHWGVVVRSHGDPAWVPIPGTGPNGLWSNDDTTLAAHFRRAPRSGPGAGSAELQTLIDRFRAQRLAPLATALGTSSQKLIVLPSRWMTGIPIEAAIAPARHRTVSYAPSATLFKLLREKPHSHRDAGLLAVGDPVYRFADDSSEPPPLPGHGLLVNVVVPGSNAAKHGFKAGDVLLAYNNAKLDKKEDLKTIDEGGKSVVVDVWRRRPLSSTWPPASSAC